MCLQELVVLNWAATVVYTQIYTYIGEVVVSVNPYRQLDIYTDEYVERYRNKEVFERPPHVYSVADSAYHDMNRLKRDSCIVITGKPKKHIVCMPACVCVCVCHTCRL